MLLRATQILASALIACTRPEGRIGALATSTEAASAPAAPGQVDCVVDADCTTSCAHGAVSKAWYLGDRVSHDGCEDGCASKGMSARCLNAKCTEFDARGRLVPECTQRP
jgi:hypothetical protein